MPPTTPTSVTQGQSFTDTQGNQGIAQFNPNTGQSLSQGQTVTVAPPSQTQNASAINNHITSGATSGTLFPPPPPAPTQSTSNNTSIPSPLPNADGLIDQNSQPTQAQTQQGGILNRIAQLVGQNKGQTDLTNSAEASAGVPGLTKVVNDLNTQLEGLNNQATDLQNQASQGGAIQNKEQQDALGRGITAAGLAPQTAGDLRKNQIQQSAIASQALTLKSAIYGAQGNLSLAKDAADKAATAQYEDQQNQIDYQKAQLDALAPQLSKDEKAQATKLQVQLQDRQTQIDNAKADKQSIIALATAALKNNPNDPQAQYAAQQALALSNSPQPDLTQAFQLVGKYQTDPVATQQALLNLQATRANIAQSQAATSSSNASAAKTRLETQALIPGSPANSKQQDALEQQYRNVLLKEVSNRSGSVGLQDQKVNQATHLMALVNQYKTTQTTPGTYPGSGAATGKNVTQTVYNIPKAQYSELVMGLANLISPSGQASEGDRLKLESMTANGDLNGAISYVTGTPQNGNTQAMIQNLVDSINRQGTVSQQIRDQNVGFLQGLVPTGLDPSRVSALNQNTLASFNNGDPYAQYRSQLQPGEILVNRDGKLTAIQPNELWKTDIKL